MPPSEQQAESQRAQRQYLRRQQAESVAMVTRDRVDLPHADWTPLWDFVPPAYASPGNQDRLPCMPAFMAYPLYSGMPSAGQTAAQMDAAMFPDYHAEVDNIPRVGEPPSNTYVREMDDEFFRAQETRGAPMTYEAHGQIPHYGYLPPSADNDVVPFGPSSAPIPIPDSLAALRPEIFDIHTSQQANLHARANHQQRNQVWNARRVEAMRVNPLILSRPGR